MSGQYLNESRPDRVPVRTGTESYPAQARLVGLDGAEQWVDAVVVRHAPPRHVMCRIHTDRPVNSDALGFHNDATYIWLDTDDVTGAPL